MLTAGRTSDKIEQPTSGGQSIVCGLYLLCAGVAKLENAAVFKTASCPDCGFESRHQQSFPGELAERPKASDLGSVDDDASLTANVVAQGFESLTLRFELLRAFMACCTQLQHILRCVYVFVNSIGESCKTSLISFVLI